jgi:AraC family transcriptional regulator
MRIDRRTASVRHWPGMRSEYSWLPPDGGVTTTKPHQLGVSFSAHPRLVHELAGRARYLAVPAGAVFVTGSERMRWSEVREPAEALEIYPDLSLLLDRTSGSGPVEIEAATAAHDATVLGVAAVLRRAHLGDLPLDELQASTLAHRLVDHLADHYSRPSPWRSRYRPRPGRLDRRLLDRVARFVEDHLSEPLLLDDLAREARLSPYHFARSFKASTGLAPHEFVTSRRLDRAKALLLSTGHSVPDVAYQVGYRNLSHFRRLFRRHTGLLPSDLRPTGDGPNTARSDLPGPAGTMSPSTSDEP